MLAELDASVGIQPEVLKDELAMRDRIDGATQLAIYQHERGRAPPNVVGMDQHGFLLLGDPQSSPMEDFAKAP